jgi:hypothetical protein
MQMCVAWLNVEHRMVWPTGVLLFVSPETRTPTVNEDFISHTFSHFLSHSLPPTLSLPISPSHFLTLSFTLSLTHSLTHNEDFYPRYEGLDGRMLFELREIRLLLIMQSHKQL